MKYVGFKIFVDKNFETNIFHPLFLKPLHEKSVHRRVYRCMYTHTISTVFKEPLPWQVWTGVCVKMSQNLTVVSPEPLATWQPSGLKLTDITASAW